MLVQKAENACMCENNQNMLRKRDTKVLDLYKNTLHKND